MASQRREESIQGGQSSSGVDYFGLPRHCSGDPEVDALFGDIEPTESSQPSASGRGGDDGNDGEHEDGEEADEEPAYISYHVRQMAAGEGLVDDMVITPWATREIMSFMNVADVRDTVIHTGLDGTSFSCYAPNTDSVAHLPPGRWHTVFKRSLQYGCTLPYHPLVKEVCSRNKLCPSQLAPNCYAIFASMWVLWKKAFGLELSWAEFCFCYKLKATATQVGFYHMTSWGSARPRISIIEGLPSSNHTWKPEFFFIEGDLYTHPLDRQKSYRDLPTSWRASSKDSSL